MAQTFTTPIELRFSDLDAYGHVNSAVYFTYLEMARIKLFSDFFMGLTTQKILTLVAKAECEYKLPILYGDQVVVSVTLVRIGRSSFDLEYTIHDNSGKTYATARTTMVCFDDENKCTTPVPEEIRQFA